MNVTVQSKSSVEQQLVFEIPDLEVNAAFKKILEKKRKATHIRGFRPGKVPLDLIRKNFKDEMAQEVLTEIVGKNIREYIKEHDVELISTPKVTDISNPIEGKPYSFTLELALKPKIGFKDFKGQSFKRPEILIAETEVDAKVADLLKAFATKEEKEAELGADAEDVLFCDIDLYFADQLDRERSRKNYWLALNEQEAGTWVLEACKGRKKGEQFSYDIKASATPAENAEATPAARAQIKVHGVYRLVLPELNQNFLDKLQLSSAEELRNSLRESLKNQVQSKADWDLILKWGEKIHQEYPFEVPESFMLREARLMLFNQGLSARQVRTIIENPEFLKQSKDEILRLARTRLLLNHGAELEGIKVGDEEFRELWAQIIRDSPERIPNDASELDLQEIAQGAKDDVVLTKMRIFILENASIES